MNQGNRAILFLTSWYPVQSNPSHGIFVRNHALALSQYQNVIVAYAYSCDKGPYYKVEHKNVNQNFTEYFVRYPKSSSLLKSWQSFSKFKKAHRLLISHIAQKHVDVVATQLNIIFPAAVVLPMYKRAFLGKHTIVEHWSGYLENDGNYKGFLLKYFTKKCFSSAAKIWHVSEAQKEAMKKHGLNGNFELLYNAVNTKIFALKRNEPERIKLLHVSSLVEKEKNISGTFRIFKKLQDDKLEFDIVIAGGDGHELDAAKKMAEQSGLNNITFTGSSAPERIAELMQESTALVLFSNYEGMPVVALEALSSGLPVFASKAGQLPFMIKDEFGVLVDIGNEEQMTEALKKLFSKQYHFNSSAMHDFVVKHASYEAVGKQMNEYYKDVIATMTNTKS
jgi:glycosyltransferase involved in cell wall biosynthesis